uniref:Uncharacterized protein n=1 Tax=Mus musculus TaxID=10090 RepID=Q9D7W2_MOUSE|nr:unnamed protein product [Mus musculus]
MFVFRGIPGGLLHERSFFLPCVPPTYYFVSASALCSMVLLPFASRSQSFHFRIPNIDVSHLPNVACLCHPQMPLPPLPLRIHLYLSSPSLWQDESEPLRTFIMNK